MLVLSRKKHEQLVMGEHGEIVLTVMDIQGDKVRLGVEAPKAVPVHRREVWEAIHRADARSEDESP